MVQYGAIEMLSFALQTAFHGMSVWAAVIIFRKRGIEGWMALTGSAVGIIAMAAANAWPYLMNPVVSSGSTGEDWLLIWRVLHMLSGLGNLIFLGGLVMYLLRKTSEAERIEQLEAIIRDRDQAS